MFYPFPQWWIISCGCLELKKKKGFYDPIMPLFQACPDLKLSLSRSETVKIRVIHCTVIVYSAIDTEGKSIGKGIVVGEDIFYRVQIQQPQWKVVSTQYSPKPSEGKQSRRAKRALFLVHILYFILKRKNKLIIFPQKKNSWRFETQHYSNDEES